MYWEPGGCIGNPEGCIGNPEGCIGNPEGVYWEPRGVYWEPRGGVLGTWGVGLGELEAAEKFAIVSPFAMSRAV